MSGPAALTPRKWHLVAATFDGHESQLFSEGNRVADGKLDLGAVSGVLEMAPPVLRWPDGKHFSGKIAGLRIFRHALTVDELKALAEKPADFSAVLFEEGAPEIPASCGRATCS